MSRRGFGPALGIAALLSEVACSQRQAWQYDESRRIEEVMSSKKFSDDLAALNGTAFAAPPSDAPPLPASNYEIQHAPQKKRPKPSRSSKRRARQYDDVTSQDGGADSVSRRP